jgi:hypothetical protein
MAKGEMGYAGTATTALAGAVQGVFGARRHDGDAHVMNGGDDDPAQEDRRSDPRRTGVLRVARLVHQRGEQLCYIRNLSSGGAMVEVAGDYRPGDEVALELGTEEWTQGTVIWAEQSRVGIAFHEPVDVLAIVAARPDAGQTLRLPRFKVAADVRLLLRARERIVRAENVSIHGINVILGDPDCVGAQVVVTVDGFPPLTGTIRWQSEGRAGIAFDEPIDRDMLSFWLAEQSRSGASDEI